MLNIKKCRDWISIHTTIQRNCLHTYLRLQSSNLHGKTHDHNISNITRAYTCKELLCAVLTSDSIPADRKNKTRWA